MVGRGGACWVTHSRDILLGISQVLCTFVHADAVFENTVIARAKLTISCKTPGGVSLPTRRGARCGFLDGWMALTPMRHGPQHCSAEGLW